MTIPDPLERLAAPPDPQALREARERLVEFAESLGGSGPFTPAATADLRRILSALDACEEALEPFAKVSTSWGAIDRDDAVGVFDDGDLLPENYDLRISDFRRAARIHAALKGEQS